MKKRIIMLILTVLTIIIINNINPKSKEDFYIYNSIKTSFDNYESAILQVIVNSKNTDTEDLYNQIIEFYCQSEKLNQITINLYKSKSDLEKSNCYASQKFEF